MTQPQTESSRRLPNAAMPTSASAQPSRLHQQAPSSRRTAQRRHPRARSPPLAFGADARDRPPARPGGLRLDRQLLVDVRRRADYLHRFARNLATGVGLVYNPGEWHLGTTAPFYALILGGLGRLAGPESIPFFGALISSAALTLGGLALAAFGAQHRAPLAGIFAGMFYVTNPMMFVTFSGEMPLQMALILWGLGRVSRRAPAGRRGAPRGCDVDAA